jgi:hypothetical protein
VDIEKVLFQKEKGKKPGKEKKPENRRVNIKKDAKKDAKKVKRQGHLKEGEVRNPAQEETRTSTQDQSHQFK